MTAEASKRNGVNEDLPLQGLRVLDFAQFLAGPVAALRLCDLGAEVIKIERPQGGDLCRGMVVKDKVLDGDSLVFHTFNRGKKSVAADLKQDSDLERVRMLISTADVMIHNFRPGVMERIGLGYDAVREINPRIIYGAVTGYGNDGLWRDKPGQDLLVQALSGGMWLNGNASDGPVPTAYAITDMATAGNLVQGVLACLLRRETTGVGGLVEVNLLSSALDQMFEQFTCFLNDDNQQPRRHETANANPYQPAPYGVYKTADGYLAFAMTPLAKVAELLEAPEIADYGQERAYSKLDDIKAIIARIISGKSTRHWLKLLEPEGVWCARVMDWPEFIESEGFKALGPVQRIRSESGSEALTTLCPIRIDGESITSSLGAPALGAHTDSVLGELTSFPTSGKN